MIHIDVVLQRFILWLILGGLILAACTPLPALPGSSNLPSQSGGQPTLYPPTLTPFQPLPPDSDFLTPIPPTATAIPATSTSAPNPASLPLWLDPALPDGLRSSLAEPAGFRRLDGELAPGEGALRLVVGAENTTSRWVYALVTPFPNAIEGISLEDIRRSWSGEARGPFAGRPLLLDPNTLAVFTAWWGTPAQNAVQSLPAADLLGYAWDHRPAWVLVPFEAIEPRWRVLPVDGRSPLSNQFDLQTYPLTVPVSLVGDRPDLDTAVNRLQSAGLPTSNRDPNRLTVLDMTGVTALVRATAFAMENQGILYPAGDVGELLRSADLTHISNEVPFAENCPYPNPNQVGVVFCSDARYIALLEEVGTDIVELTGDHFADWGQAAMLYTLELYNERGWQYYGGGADIEEGRRALLVEHNGNRLAFIGCNAKGAAFAKAGPDNPGAVTCDFPAMEAEITRLREEGYLPVATFQHFEYYTYQAQPNQIADSRRLAEAGAVIVSGSQAHQPQGMEFWGDAFIHYGLGNLFFDQYSISYACRQGFIDRHVFYDGRYLGVELVPILFIDYARPRFMTTEERNDLFNSVFTASGW